MDIKLYIGQEKEIVLAINEEIDMEPSAVFFDEDRHLLYFFLNDGKAFEMDCQIDTEYAPILEKQSFCHLGFFQKGVMVRASTLPLLHSQSVFMKG